MSRDWKPGDVAMVTEVGGGNGEPVVAIRTASATWQSAFGESGTRHIVEERPLVVIDPEDREQVERLADAFATHPDCLRNYGFDAMQAALRSLITPPKPKEPLGLGAVVEDAKGKRWVRGRDSNCHWYPETGFDRTVGPWAPWAEIAAVKVLSPGVTA